jgi:deoxyribodipyrimidine photo-lyase
LSDKLSSEEEKKSVFHFMSEVVWREFSYYLLYHFPKLPYQNFNSKFDNFSWENNREFLTSWGAGSTGFPIIDAAMEQLWNTGWMHNRLRMVVGSFLIKNLLVDWRLGERYFFNTLVDYDLASNSFGWQWVAGSGADASPYFRIFNPILQSQKFDTDCIFIKKYLPVVQNVENNFIHDPFLQSNHKQVDLFGKRNYYKPIVDLSKSRNKALEIYKSLK